MTKVTSKVKKFIACNKCCVYEQQLKKEGPSSSVMQLL